MGFQEQYRLLDVLADKETRVFRAVQAITERPVLVHQIISERTPAGCTPLANLVFQYSQDPSHVGTGPFLDMGDFGGHIYVVTEDAESFIDLRSWLDPQMRPAESPSAGGTSALPADSPQADGTTARFFSSREILGKARVENSPAPSPGVPPMSETLSKPAAPVRDEFERLSGQNKKTPIVGTRPISTVPGAGAPSLPSHQDSVPGEFTSLFLATGKDASSHSPQAAEPIHPVRSAAPPPPEHFCSLEAPVRSPGSPAAKPPAAGSVQSKVLSQQAQARSSEPGEFTRMFSQEGKPAIPGEPQPAQKSAISGVPVGRSGSAAMPEGFEVVFRRRRPPTKAASTSAFPENQQAPGSTPVSPLPPERPSTFTQFFQQGGKAEVSTSPSKERTDVPPVTAPRTAGQPPQAPGEFTRIFYAQPSQPSEASVGRSSGTSQPSIPPSPAHPASEGPGEFTRMFSSRPIQKTDKNTSQGVALPQDALPRSSPPTPSHGPGEFTMMFQSPREPTAAAPVAPSRPSPAPAPAESAWPAGPSEYTRIISGQGLSGQPGAPAPIASPAGPAAPVQAPGIPLTQTPQVTASAIPQPVYVQPGQFQAGTGGVYMQAPQVTPVMLPAPGQFAPPTPPVPGQVAIPQTLAAAGPARKKRSFLPLIIILGSIFVVTLGLILFFTLRH